MSKKWATITIVVLVLILIGYILVDVALKEKAVQTTSTESGVSGNSDHWIVNNVFEPGKGQLNAVAVSSDKLIFLGGEPFIACYDSTLKLLWEYETGMPVTALAVSGESVYASVQEVILVLNRKGEKTGEWGPFESNSMITSISANDTYVAFADAANRTVFILDKEGIVKHLIGKSGEPFVIPSPYFDVAFGNDNALFIANTGNRRIEKRNPEGALLDFFGEPGTGPDAFCGCCNPSHFALLPDGYVTAEKGINRIKIINNKGDFVEFVSADNNFVPSLPLDIASPDGRIIYGANPADSKLYIFSRK